MIKKINRLNENEVKKVLRIWKPFFSYWVVLNKIKSKLPQSRFWIVIWSKSVKNNVTRNFFRRRFYDFASWFLNGQHNDIYDMVFVVKKSTKLDKNDKDVVSSFDKDIKFLISKI